MLTRETLIENLRYDPVTGYFYRLRSSSWAKIGDRAGRKDDPETYTLIGLLGHKYTAHRLAWLYVHGEFPKGMIDHINRDKSDNRIENLREVTRAQNAMNSKMNVKNSSGYKGVFFHRGRQEWRAQINIRNRVVNIGKFASAEAAHLARLRAITEEWGVVIGEQSY